jgi:hypothetical protein
MSIKYEEICPYQLVLGCKPKLPTSLRPFDEIGIVTTKDTIQDKLNEEEHLVYLLDILYIK